MEITKMQEIIITILIRTTLLTLGVIFITRGIVLSMLRKFKERLDKIEDDVYEYEPRNFGEPFSSYNKVKKIRLDHTNFKIENLHKRFVEKLQELEKKITEPKYNELMEYLDKHKGEVKKNLERGGFSDIENRYVFNLFHKINELEIYKNEKDSLFFKDKQINLHPDQIQSLFDKAEEYWKAKELLREEPKLKTKKRKK